MMPWEFAELSYDKRVALIGMISVRVDAEKKQQRELDRMKSKK